jgi:hypothetical protein
MALAETSSSLQPYVYFTRAYPTMPISPTYVAAGYPLSKPLHYLRSFSFCPVLQNQGMCVMF